MIAFPTVSLARLQFLFLLGRLQIFVITLSAQDRTRSYSLFSKLWSLYRLSSLKAVLLLWEQSFTLESIKTLGSVLQALAETYPYLLKICYLLQLAISSP